MNKKHLDQFRHLSNDVHSWEGLNQLHWWKDIFKNRSTNLESKKLSRNELKEICKNQKYSDEDVLGAVMAWGRMRRKNASYLPQNLESICEIIDQLRTRNLSREDAYSRFYKLRSRGKLSGMGPAYYTKLIFFCSPRHDGYIMDQWTSKSINLIFESCVVDLSRAGYVKHNNSPECYGRFCKAVETLSAEIGEPDAEKTEIRLFSDGWKKGDWRNYVVRHWKPCPTKKYRAAGA